MIKTTKYSILLVAAWMCILSMGCNRLPDRPEGLPPLYPCKMTVTFGGKTLEDVTVSLLPEDKSSKWKSGGQTDGSGDVAVKTAFAFPGAPEGKYTVAFVKQEERIGNTSESMTPVSLIPLKYGPTKSTEKVEIAKGKNQFTFELDGGEEKLAVPKGNIMRKPPL